MSVTARVLETAIEGELAGVSDSRVVQHIRGMLVAPHVVLRNWDYGEPGQQYPCWFVLQDAQSSGEIAYCEYGFGPRCPWGLVSSADDEQHGLRVVYDVSRCVFRVGCLCGASDLEGNQGRS
jgi:hypothetical protein